MNQSETTKLLARLDSLPDLYSQAHASGKDVHAEQARLALEHDALKNPYRISMPYRNPGQPCKSGEHRVAMIQHTLVSPAHRIRAVLWETELHEARVHGEFLPPAVEDLLNGLPDPVIGTTGHDSLSKQVDQALRKHGDFGVYGDLRAGLQELRETHKVRLSKANNGIDVSAIPLSGRGHEFFFFVNTDGTINPPMAGESVPTIPQAPGTFKHVMLRDVEGMNGGQNVSVYSNGKVVVQLVSPAQGSKGMLEQRYEWQLNAKQLLDLRQTLAQHPPRPRKISRPGVPGEVHVEIDFLGDNGTRVTMHQWADDAQADFAALYRHLLRYTKEPQKNKLVREGKYEPDWRPEYE